MGDELMEAENDLVGQSFFWDRPVTLRKVGYLYLWCFAPPWPAALFKLLTLSTKLSREVRIKATLSVGLCGFGRERRPSRTRTWFLSPRRHLCHLGTQRLPSKKHQIKQPALIPDTRRARGAAMLPREGDLKASSSAMYRKTQKCLWEYRQTQ